MTADERAALELIQMLAEAEIETGTPLIRILKPHATDVMQIWNLQVADVLFALADATSCSRLKEGRYRLPADIDGRAWSFIVEVEPEALVVTLFIRGKRR